MKHKIIKDSDTGFQYDEECDYIEGEMSIHIVANITSYSELSLVCEELGRLKERYGPCAIN